MADPISFNQLEIVGYATVLTESMTPSVVPPIFRCRQSPERIFVPPYRFSDGCVHRASEITIGEFEELRLKGEVTALESPTDAKNEFELWVDVNLTPHYEERFAVDQQLRKIALSSLNEAYKALAAHRFNDAVRLANTALSANDRLPEPFALKAAISKLRADLTGLRLFTKLADGLITTSGFEALMNDNLRRAEHGNKAKSHTQTLQPLNRFPCARPMAGAAMLKAA